MTLLRTEKMAQVLDITPNTLRQWARTRDIPFVRLSRKSLRFDEREVLAWFQSKQAKENSE